MQKKIVPQIEDDQIPAEKGKNNSPRKTVFSESARSEYIGDRQAFCQSFSCSLEEAQMCRNELSTLYMKPCSRHSCMFWGNCYLCVKDRCDGKGAYLFHS